MNTIPQSQSPQQLPLLEIQGTPLSSDVALCMDFLHALPLFSGLSLPDLERLLQMAEYMRVGPGTLLIQEGTMGEVFYIIIEGLLEVTKSIDGRETVLGVRKRGEVIGEMALIEGVPRSASIRSIQGAELLVLSKEAFTNLLTTSPQASLAILKTMTMHLRESQAALRQTEKMAALSTLTAGLLHELNNPAAAARASAAQLGDALARWQESADKLIALNPNDRQKEAIHLMRERMVLRASQPADLDPITRSDKEVQLEDWLADRGFDKGWELSSTLVQFGFDCAEFSEITSVFDPAQIGVVAEWLEGGCSVYSLLEQVGTSTQRISQIADGFKKYSALDQAPIQNINVNDSLENTLAILQHKIGEEVAVRREYDHNLPSIEAYASELNQVWTKIIENALEAMGNYGELLLRTYQKEDNVVVEIGDTGPGIPEAIQPRIFEAFFTTKPPGQGQGLGLHVAYSVVANKHRGTITFESHPGHTVFRITLPKQLPKS